jgi:hypothetical protein
MSAYPPYPIFTLVGFLVHALVFSAISLHFFGKRQIKSLLYLGIATGVDAINFWLLIVLFYFFPNNDIKTLIFFLNAFLLKPFVSIFALMSLISVKEKFARFAWAFFAVALVIVAILFADALGEFRATVPQYAFVHPAYPEIAAVHEGSSVIGAISFCVFFLYHAFSQSLFVRHRALILAAAVATWGLGTFYWTAGTPQWYIVTHVVGVFGSVLAAIGVLMFHPPAVRARELTEKL